MERYSLRNIFTLVMFSWDLVLTQEVIYQRLGSTAELVCPIVKTIRAITWLGPSNYKHYAVGTEVVPAVSTQVAINETAIDKKSILLIHRRQKWKYRCTDSVERREFNLLIKRNPSDLVIVNATGRKITSVQGREQYLECRITSGQPGGNLTWSTDGSVVARNGPSLVSYSLIPERSDNGKAFICEAFNSDGESILKSSVILEVFNIPKISFSPKQTLTVKENEQAQLICINDGNDQNATTVWKRRRTSTIVQSNCILNFKNVKRTDAGLYTCIVDTRVGVYEDNARVIVQYLVVTQESIYKSLGSSVKLVCPIIKTNRAITWLGPPNFKVYAAGTDVSKELSSQVKINVTDKKSILLINRFTKDKSGKFRCTDIYINVKTEFNLIIKKNPSDLIIGNATGDKITAVEGREQQLECRVTSGEPGGNITWSMDGAVVAENGPSLVTYRLTPKRSDKGKLFKCAAFNSDGEKILESSVLLKVFYIPKISFIPRQTLTVKEGAEAQLICINDGNDPDASTVWKRQYTNTNITQNDQLIFKSINRTDAGLYICRVDTKAGVYEDSAKVDVQYAPTIDIRYSPNERKMKCFPNGMPDRYLFEDWEHTTEYNNHLRFLPITKEGKTAILTFPTKVTGKDQFRDRGTYICRASNNISSIDGMFVMRKYNLTFNSIPYFVSSNENVQFGAYLKTAEIKINFVSVPEYNSCDVYKNGSKFTDYTETVYRNKKMTDNIYGKNVSVKGSIISFKIQIDSEDDFNLYKVVVKNAEGPSHHTIKLVSASAPFMPMIFQVSAQQTAIYVLWKPGFDGGYRQWFIVEYQEIEDMYWDNQTTNSSNSLLIGGLQPATKYLIRMFARNMIDDSNRTEEILVQTDKRVAETNSSAIVSLVAVLLCLLIVVAYFRRGKLKQFIYTRFSNQANARAIGNDLNELHTHRDSAAEIPVYSSIDKRHNLRLHKTGAYTVDQKGITNPLKSVHQNRETGKHVNRVSQFESMKCSSEIEQKEKESRELNYVEIIFDQKPVYPFTIHGLDDKTNYMEIDFTQSADPLPDSDRESERDK